MLDTADVLGVLAPVPAAQCDDPELSPTPRDLWPLHAKRRCVVLDASYSQLVSAAVEVGLVELKPVQDIPLVGDRSAWGGGFAVPEDGTSEHR